MLALMAVLVAVFATWALVSPGRDSHDWLFAGVLYVVTMLGGALLCVMRAAAVKAERAAWALFGAGLLVWTVGNAYWAIVTFTDGVPLFGFADVFFFLSYPLLGAGLVSLLRARIGRLDRGALLDGLIAAALFEAIMGTFVMDGLVRSATAGNGPVTLWNLAYPAIDLLCIGLLAGAAAHRRWSTRGWGVIALALLMFALSDSVYMVRLANGSYVPGTIADLGWLLAALSFGWAAWRPAPVVARPGCSDQRVWVPVVLGIAALATLLYATLGASHHRWLGLTFAAASLLAMIARLGLTFAENRRMLLRAEHEANTDALTGLANRRLLMHDIARRVADASDREPLVVAFFDLDGFKLYNDTFGHSAGDALLARLSCQLQDAVSGENGRAYRAGGDEFCVLAAPPAGAGTIELVERAAAALTADGDGFRIGCSHGLAIVPDDTRDPHEALRLGDQRMYERKGRDRRSSEQTAEALLQAVRERNPELGDHSGDVTGLAVSIARALGMPERDAEDVRLAAELHDVGKMAIPDAILHKPGPLDEHEWEFMRRHTIVGARIVGAAPALAGVAEMVRSSHERWDGGGYPDGLAREEIPLGARIVAVCDAYDAIVSDRVYRAGRSHGEALAEIARCSGGQFDPCVVEALLAYFAADLPVAATAG